MEDSKIREKRTFDIITAAMILFVQKGYEGTTMENIAVVAGLSKGGVYHHFRNKEQILIAANNRFMEPIRDFMKIALDGHDSLQSLKQFIAKYLDYWVNHKNELGFTFLSFSRIVANRQLWTYMDKYTGEMIGFYEYLLKKAIAQGALKPHHTKARAVAIMSSLDGSLMYLAMGETLKPDITANYFENVFFKDIETHETRTGI